MIKCHNCFLFEIKGIFVCFIMLLNRFLNGKKSFIILNFTLECLGSLLRHMIYNAIIQPCLQIHCSTNHNKKAKSSQVYFLQLKKN